VIVTAAAPARYPAVDSKHSLALDLIDRTNQALTDVSQLSVNTGITFSVGDVVRTVEDNLPNDYPAPTKGSATREDLIARIARDILNGEVFED
jgi:hypothetical protein